MLRCDLTKRTNCISYKDFAFGISSYFQNPLHRNIFFNTEHFIRCQQNYVSIISWINGFLEELHGSIFQP